MYTLQTLYMESNCNSHVGHKKKHSCPVLPAFVSGTPDYPFCMQGLMEYCPEDPMGYVTEHDRIQSGGSHELCHRINPWTKFHMMEYCLEDPMSYVTE